MLTATCPAFQAAWRLITNLLDSEMPLNPALSPRENFNLLCLNDNRIQNCFDFGYRILIDDRVMNFRINGEITGEARLSRKKDDIEFSFRILPNGKFKVTSNKRKALSSFVARPRAA